MCRQSHDNLQSVAATTLASANVALTALVDVLGKLVVALLATIRSTVASPSLMIALVVALKVVSDPRDDAQRAAAAAS